MSTRPLLDDLLDGVTRTLEQVVLPQLAGREEAERIARSVLMVLRRVYAEWPEIVTQARRDAEDIRSTLEGVRTVLANESCGPRFAEMLENLPADPTVPDAPAVLAHVRRLNESLVEAMEIADLPPRPGEPKAVHAADDLLRELLRRLGARETATHSEDLARMWTGKSLRPRETSAEGLMAQLGRFIHANVYGTDVIGTPAVEITNLTRLMDGASRDTYFFDVTYEDATDGRRRQQRCVLQQEAISGILDSDEAEGGLSGTRRRPETEFKVLQAVRAAGIPVPEPLWVDATGHWLGRPGFVTGWVRGSVDDTALLEPDNARRRKQVYTEFVRIVARLHQIDVHDAGLMFLSPASTTESVASDIVESYARAYLANRLEVIPAVDYLIRWCRRNLPVASKLALVHGDYRRGQTLIDGDEITAVLDWEQCHLGDPMEDIAFIYSPLCTLDPVMDIEEFLTIYEAELAHTVDRDALAFYRMYTELKMLCVTLTAMKSFFATDSRQLHYATFASSMAAAKALRALDELSNGGPTFRYEAARDATRLI